MFQARPARRRLPRQGLVQGERLYLYSGLGTPQNPPATFGWFVQGKGSVGPPETAASTTLPPISSWQWTDGWMYVWMDGWMDGGMDARTGEQTHGLNKLCIQEKFYSLVKLREKGKITNACATSIPQTGRGFIAWLGNWYFRAMVKDIDSTCTNLSQIKDQWVWQMKLTYSFTRGMRGRMAGKQGGCILEHFANKWIGIPLKSNSNNGYIQNVINKSLSESLI